MTDITKIKCGDVQIPKITDYTISSEPLWGKDAGRSSMEGQFSGTFIGYFTNIELNIGKTTPEELDLIKDLLEHPLINLTYPLEKTMKYNHGAGLITIPKGTLYTEPFYGIGFKSKVKGKLGYEPFSLSMVATTRRPQYD